MFYKMRFILLGAVLCMMAFTKSGTGHVKWVVEPNSTLRVQGKSNVNSFTCNINVNTEQDTICFINASLSQVRLSGDIQMDILGFNCHSSLITKDLRKTLKATEYPTMTIRFLSLESMPLLQHKDEIIKGWVEVELAGVVKKFELSYSFSTKGTGILLNGGREFCFSDFKLSPPKKLAGLIRIKDEFNVNFQLILRAI